MWQKHLSYVSRWLSQTGAGEHNLIDKKLSWCWQTRATRLGSVQVTKHGTIRYVWYGFLLVCYSNFVPSNIPWPWNRGQGLLKVIENNTIWYTTYYIILMIHSNYGSVSYIFWDFQCRKISLPWNSGRQSRSWKWYNLIDWVWFPVSVL